MYNKSLTLKHFDENYLYLYSAIQCYEKIDKKETALSDQAKKDLNLILEAASSKAWFGPSWSSIRFQCKAFCLRYGGYLLCDQQNIQEGITQIKNDIAEIKRTLNTTIKK